MPIPKSCWELEFLQKGISFTRCLSVSDSVFVSPFPSPTLSVHMCSACVLKYIHAYIMHVGQRIASAVISQGHLLFLFFKDIVGI